MKQHIIIAALSILQFPVFPQSSGNYIQTRTMTNESGTEYMETIRYFDGLGRPVQTVQKGAGGQGQDIVTATEYDWFGREWRQYLPTPVAGNNGAYVRDIYRKAGEINGDRAPYSETVYESSPLERVLQQFGPGQEWHDNGKAVKTEYLFNISADTRLNCNLYRVLPSHTLKKEGNYASNTLYVTKTTGEDGEESYEFKDTQGQLLLTRQVSQNRNHDTYYVYDDFGLLRFVIPPMAASLLNTNSSWTITSDVINKYVYYYSYDDWKRCIAKKLPGQGGTTMQYDKADRLIIFRESVQSSRSEYTFTIPDEFGRMVLKGTCKNPVIHSGAVVKAVFSADSGDNFLGTGYTVSGVSFTDAKLLTANYYDNYLFKQTTHFRSNTHLDYLLPAGFNDKRHGTDGDPVAAKGLLTGSRTLVFDDYSTYLLSASYYDDKGRVVQAVSSNITNGYDRETISYTFTGLPHKRHLDHDGGGFAYGVSELYRYTYDRAGRVLNTYHELNPGQGNPEIPLSRHTYDGWGRIASKKVYNESTGYDYNIRGWQTKISSPKFTEELFYTNNPDPSGKVYYSGNISAIRWKSADKPALQRGYSFRYDGLHRLENSIYFEGEDWSVAHGGYNERLGYDLNGNLNMVTRNGFSGTSNRFVTIDDVYVVQRNGNRLQEVVDMASNGTSNDLMEFRDVNGGSVEYTYDTNGNMTSDKNRGITSIEYNLLNLPQKITFANGNDIRYVYDASGRKLRMGHYRNNYLETEKTYCGNKVYQGEDLTMVLTEEGYCRYDGTGDHTFFLKDHLGNNRVVFDMWGTTFQVTNYYPFGSVMAESPRRNDREFQPYKFGGKELDRMFGLDQYDFVARGYYSPLGGFLTMDPLCEKYYSISPYVYCANNPVNLIDPDGMDWYWINNDDKKNRSLQYDPNVTKDSKLGENQKYAGETVKYGTGTYRKDGSIMFTNETDAYNRMWSQATEKKIEESGYPLANGNILVIPDYKNKADDASPSKYQYSVKDGKLTTKDGETFKITGNVHTHQDASKDATPSFTGKSGGDVGHSRAMGGLPIMTIGHDGKVHGVFWSVKGEGFRSIPGLGSRDNLLSGKTLLVPWLRTYPSIGQ